MSPGHALLAAALELTDIALNLLVWILIVNAILSWLVAFNIINTHNRLVQTIGDFLYRFTEPLLRPIRRVVPAMGGLDLSPLVLILLVMFVQSFIRHLVF